MELDPRLHFLTVTGIVVRKDADGGREYLISKRSMREKAFPGKWTVPGGKLVRSEYEKLPYKTDYPQWYNLVEWTLRKEIREEVGLEIEKPQYLTDLVFVRPDGYAVAVLSYWAWYKSGTVTLNHEMEDSAWIKAADAKNYDMIDGIDKEIAEVEELLAAKVE